MKSLFLGPSLYAHGNQMQVELKTGADTRNIVQGSVPEPFSQPAANRFFFGHARTVRKRIR